MCFDFDFIPIELFHKDKFPVPNSSMENALSSADNASACAPSTCFQELNVLCCFRCFLKIIKIYPKLFFKCQKWQNVFSIAESFKTVIHYVFNINIRTWILGVQWRHKLNIIYGYGLWVYIHRWQIRDVTNRQLFTRGD